MKMTLVFGEGRIAVYKFINGEFELMYQCYNAPGAITTPREIIFNEDDVICAIRYSDRSTTGCFLHNSNVLNDLMINSRNTNLHIKVHSENGITLVPSMEAMPEQIFVAVLTGQTVELSKGVNSCIYRNHDGIDVHHCLLYDGDKVVGEHVDIYGCNAWYDTAYQLYIRTNEVTEDIARQADEQYLFALRDRNKRADLTKASKMYWMSHEDIPDDIRTVVNSLLLTWNLDHCKKSRDFDAIALYIKEHGGGADDYVLVEHENILYLFTKDGTGIDYKRIKKEQNSGE